MGRFLKRLFLYLIIFVAIVTIGFLIWASILILTLPSPDIVVGKALGGSTQIYDRTGNILLYEIGIRRYWVDYKDIPLNIIYSVLAAEDDSFFQHYGVSLKGILRAIWLDIKTGSLEYGGSTITQQLVRNLFLGNEKTLSRKFKEIILALEFERKFSKEQILTYYLNTINFGYGNIGVKAAADFYFNKDLKDIDWNEAVILASIPKSPKYYAPVSEENIKRLENRKKFILNRLKELGWISDEDYKTALNEEIKLCEKKYYKIAAPHFVLEVKKILEENYPDINLETAGWKVITTLNYDYQKIAEEAVKTGVERNKKLYQGNNASLLMMDSNTGEILAMVGSYDFNNKEIQGQVNMTTWPRQLGSAFKPFSYVTLFQLGYPIETIVFDVKTNFGTDKNPYIPQNFDKKFRGPVNLRTALAQSLNVPSIKVFYLAGPERVIENARKFGITTLKDYKNYGLSLGVGTAEIRMIDAVRAYSVFSNDGELVTQSLILKIIDSNGKVIYKYKPSKIKVIDSQPVRMLNSILKDVEARKGLFGSNLNLTYIEGYDIALKTGTSDYFRDAWAFGYTPNFVVAVWAGNTDGTPMKAGVSIVAALPIWHSFVSQIIKDYPNTKFVDPIPVKVDKPMLNGEWQTPYGIHDILFYVDRNNPLGPIPQNPYKDPQYLNWEIGVENWLNSY
jgi:penicillin-binding protein 1C